MTQKVGTIILPVVLAVLTAASMAFARTSNIDISEAYKLGNGPTIKAGWYKVKVLDSQTKPEAVFYKNGKEVAEVPVQLINTPKKYAQTEVLSNTEGSQHVMTELRFRGWREKVLLKGALVPVKSKS